MEQDTHLTLQSIADLEQKTKSAIMRRAGKENWSYREITARGGTKREYSLYELPTDIQVLYNKVETEKQNSGIIKKDDQENTSDLPQQQQTKAAAKADLLRLYLKSVKNSGWGSKAKTRTSFMRAYNSGIAYPKLFNIIGKTHWKTIEGWKRLLQSSTDSFSLADRRGYTRKGQCILNDEQEKILLKCVLHPNRPKISEVIRMAKHIMHTKGISNGHSEATYRRWLKDWKKHNNHIWVFSREGAKPWNDKCARYIERDYSVINVGDILVADGHVLNFEILNPWTGKPKRMTMILWYDMKSSFPLGWEILPTENTQAIASALRRAIIRLGKYPKVAYLDNGKAFASRFFSNTDLEQEGFTGLFERLGIQTIFAWPYHAQSKTVERFFSTFSELERWCPSYVGTSIEKKPPRLMRGETLHRRVYEKSTQGKCITLEQAHRAIAAWFDEYAKRPQRGHLKGKSPVEIFLDGKGPGIDAAELRYLMMSMEIRTIRRNGIHFLGQNYYHPELYGRKHAVVIRYDLQDKSSILVFDKDGSYICEATPVEKIHPAAGILGNKKDQKKLKDQIELKRRLEKDASVLARNFLEEEVLPEHRKQLESIGVLPDPDKPKVKEPSQKAIELDEEKILAEVEAYKKENDQSEATDYWSDLQSMSEMDRYEKVLEAEIQGWMIPKQWAAFAKYYEQTTEYDRHADYWEEYKIKTTMMYQMEVTK